VQDEASQLVALAADVPTRRACARSVCVSRRKDTAMAAAAAPQRNRRWHRTFDPRRIRLLTDTVRATAAHNVRVVQVPQTGALPFAPVSIGSSSMPPVRAWHDSPRSDIRWRRTEIDLPQLRSRQVELLGRAAEVLAPQGTPDLCHLLQRAGGKTNR
jgi:hypothetical protein